MTTHIFACKKSVVFSIKTHEPQLDVHQAKTDQLAYKEFCVDEETIGDCILICLKRSTQVSARGFMQPSKLHFYHMKSHNKLRF